MTDMIYWAAETLSPEVGIAILGAFILVGMLELIIAFREWIN